MAGGLMGRDMARGGRRPRRRLMSEINVTPFVDVMLVLLIVFMIAAPLLTVGVEVDLPKTDARTLSPGDEEPIWLTVRADGMIYLQETEVEPERLEATLAAMAAETGPRRVLVRGDEAASYGAVMDVLARLQGAGFTNVALAAQPER